MPDTQIYKITRQIVATSLLNWKAGEVERILESEEGRKKYPNTTVRYAQDRITLEGPGGEVKAVMEAVKCGGCF